MRSLILLGTDTGVGKTTIALGLLHLAAERTLGLAPYKPVESGLAHDDASSDAFRLRQASALPGLSLADVTPYPLLRPLSPSLAARLEGRVVSTSHLLEHASRLLERYKAVLVETAGGLLSPYSRSGTPASLARALTDRFPTDVLLVTPNRLGAINQAALAHLALQHHRLPCAGVILVDTTGRTDATVTANNAGEIAASTGLSVLGQLPFLGSHPITATEAALAVRANIQLGSIMDGSLE